MRVLLSIAQMWIYHVCSRSVYLLYYCVLTINYLFKTFCIQNIKIFYIAEIFL